MNTSKNKLLTTSMAAKLLGFTANWVRRMIIKGEIKAVKHGYDWMLTEKDIAHVKRRRKPNVMKPTWNKEKE